MSAPSVISAPARLYLRLHLVDGIGPILAARLVEQLGSIEAVFAASLSRLESVEGIGRERATRITRSDPAQAHHEIELTASRGVRIICLADAEYPDLLRRIADPPIVLYVRGTLQPEDAVALAIVGSRRCSIYGGEQAERFGALAAEAGMTVVSGMALGVDTAAHRGALRAKGRTIAVLGCGMCHLYPPRSGELADQIAANGAVLSEFPMQVPPDEHNFPRRNRIVTGLALGTLVIEASMRSGALISARFANEYNREVFAVPGRIDTPHAEGCHHLIRTGGAKLVTNLADVLEELGDVGKLLLPRTDPTAEFASEPPAEAGGNSPDPAEAVGRSLSPAAEAGGNSRSARDALLFAHHPPSGPAPSAPLTEYEQLVLSAMPHEPASIETLTILSGLMPARVAAALTSLQLKGYVKRAPGDLYTKVASA